MKKHINFMGKLAMVLLVVCFFYQKSFAQECMIYDSVLTITEKDKGFCYFFPATTTGINWTSPYDYYNGMR